MEINKVEVAAIEEVLVDTSLDAVQQLDAIKLALVGGGIGEVVFG